MVERQARVWKSEAEIPAQVRIFLLNLKRIFYLCLSAVWKPEIRLILFELQRNGDTFSLISKINILNKLFPEIKFLIIIAKILLRIIFTQIKHPLAISFSSKLYSSLKRL